MLRLVFLIALAGCGRVGFEARPDAAGDTTSEAPLGHDEDGDGIGDVDDVCPHFPDAPQADDDGDRVGNVCDPNPNDARETITLFATMAAGDQPFSFDTNTDAVVTQRADSLQITGDLGVDGNLYAGLIVPIAVGSVRITLGIDVIGVVPGSLTGQKQIALQILAPEPRYFVELNEIDGMFSRAQVTHLDGGFYTPTSTMDLATGIHAGPLIFDTTQQVSTRVRFDVGWPGEPYAAEVMDGLYQGGNTIEIDINNVQLEVRYLCVIAST